MDQLNFVRNINKEQEKKIIMMEQNAKNQQNYLVDLQEKHRKLKENRTSLTGGSSDRKVEIEKQASNMEKMQSQVNILKDANESCQLKFKIEQKKLNKRISELEAENEVLKNKLRESEHVL